MTDKTRAAVARMLAAARWQRASDRAVAEAAGCHRSIVGQVRRRLIAEGRHPPRTEAAPIIGEDGKPTRGYVPAYKPGAVARGGYVYGPDGTPMREVEWLKLQANRKKAARRCGRPTP